MGETYRTSIKPKTESDAEVIPYAAVRDRLDDSYTVFNSGAWHGLDDTPTFGIGGRFCHCRFDEEILVLDRKEAPVGYVSRTTRRRKRGSTALRSMRSKGGAGHGHLNQIGSLIGRGGDQKALLYLGCSRPSHQLILLLSHGNAWGIRKSLTVT